MNGVEKGIDGRRDTKRHFIVDEGTPVGYYLASLVVIVLILAYIAIKSFDIISDEDFGIVTNVLSILAALTFFTASAWGLYRSINLKIRDGIMLFAVTSLFYVIAELLWLVYNNILNIELPYPSIVDLFYVMASITLILAIYFVTKGLRNKPKFGISMIVLIIVASVIVTALFLMISHTSITDVYKDGKLDVTMILDIGYPVLDMIVLVMMGKLLEVSQGRKVFEAQMMLAGATCLMSFSDIYFSLMTAMNQYTVGSLADYLFVIVYLIYALSVWRYVSLTRRDIVKDVASKNKSAI